MASLERYVGLCGSAVPQSLLPQVSKDSVDPDYHCRQRGPKRFLGGHLCGEGGLKKVVIYATSLRKVEKSR